MNPFGKVPTLETPEGAVWESNAIARHVARSGKKAIYGKSDIEASQIDQWLDFAATSLEPAIMQWVGPILGYLPYNKRSEQEAKEKLVAQLAVVDKYLETRTFFVGERIFLADIVLANTLILGYKLVFEPTYRQQFQNVNRWFLTCVNQPNFKTVIGEVQLCVKAAEPKKQEQPKKEQPAAKPKEQPKKEAEEPEEEEESYEEKPKGKNPLDSLPKSTFNLEEFKRVYSNSDTRTEALPFLWNNYDATGYVAYFARYKYNNELEVIFKTMNLISGFYQRLEKLHKYAFGSTVVVGESSAQEILSAWIFRGQDIPQEMRECDDFELFEWTKADTSDQATKERMNDYFAWDKPIDGKTFLDGKIFK